MTRARLRLAAIGAGLLLAFAAGEVVLRLTGIGHYRARDDVYGFAVLNEDPMVWGFKKRKIQTSQWDGDPYGVLPPGAYIEYPINDLGLRGPLPSGPEPVVLVVGDSFVFGEGVLEEQTFVRLAEQHLREDHHRLAHFVNAGIPGYGTIEESTRLPELGRQLRPRVVIVVYGTNDAVHVTESMDHGSDLLSGGVRSPLTSRVWTALSAPLLSASRTEATEEWYLSYYFGERAAAWRRARRELVAMRDWCASNGVAFGLAYFPLLHDLDGSSLDAIRDEVQGACEESDIPFVDLGPTLVAGADQELRVHPADHHPNHRAHALVAPRLAEFAAELLR